MKQKPEVLFFTFSKLCRKEGDADHDDSRGGEGENE